MNRLSITIVYLYLSIIDNSTNITTKFN